MRYLLDVAYLLGLLLLSPWLVYRVLTTGRYRHGLRDKLLGLSPGHLVTLSTGQPVWFHGVSVGEVHLLRSVVAAYRRRQPGRPCVVSTTTDTGLAEARRCFPDLVVILFPFDFSWSVRRTLRAVNPVLIVLAEGELWPNFLLAAQHRGVPVAVINGRISPRSFQRYRTLGWVARWLFRCPDLLAVQTQDHAASLRLLGAPPERIHVTGSVKYDGVGDRLNPRTQDFRHLFHVTLGDLVWVAGSTQAPEEEIVLRIYRRLQPLHPNLRLFLVPRQKDRFDEVARLLERSGLPFLRRSTLTGPLPTNSSPPATILVDTIGELGALWGLADLAFVGGSLDGRRGGQNMIEPAACGAAVVFGPHVWNFKEDAARLLAAGAACQVGDAGELEQVVTRLVADSTERRQRGEAARAFVLQQQGATQRTVDLLDELLAGRTQPGQTA
jgi:3-deoxy-D-manno-octulosonic-acid transferase